MKFKTFNLSTKIIVIFIIIFLFYLFTFYFYRQDRLKSFHLFLEHQRKEYSGLFNKIMELKSSSLINYAYDYTYWDDMVDFILTKNINWAEENIKPSLSIYGADAVWVYDLEAKNIYFTSRNNLDFLRYTLPYFKKFFEELFKDNYIRHFFLITSEGLLEVVGATIHPTKDKERKLTPQGYFFVAKFWDSVYLEDLSNLIGARIEFVSSKIEEKIDMSKGEINFLKELSSWNNKTLGYLNVTFRNNFIKTIFLRIKKLFWLLVIYLILIFILLFLFFYNLLILPLRKIKKALVSNDLSILSKIEDREDELGMLTKIISSHLLLENQLKEEIENRKALETKLKESQHYLSAIMNKVNFGIMVIEPQTHKIIDINETALKLIGLPREKVVDKECFEFICPTERGRCPITDLNQRIEQSERVLLKAAKIEIPILKSVYPIVINNKEYLLESFIDIRQRKEMENKLARLNRLFRILSEVNQLIVKIKDEEMLFKETCRLLVEIGDYSTVWIGLVDRENKIIKPIAWWGYTADYIKDINIPIEDDKNGSYSVDIVRSGRYFVCQDIKSTSYKDPWEERTLKYNFCSTAGFPIRKGLEVVGLLRVYSLQKNYFVDEEIQLLEELSQDISFALENLEKERKRVQQEKDLILAYDQLKNTQAQLIQSAKMASLGQLSVGIAHEINNPLAAIMNNLELIKRILQYNEGDVLSKIKDIVQIIEESTLRCRRIIQNLLSFSHTPEDKLEKVSLNEIIEQTLVLIEREFSLENIHINKNLSQQIPDLYLNRQLMQQAILNIVNNSVWAIKEKKTHEIGLITITTDYAQDNNEVVLSIADNGIGMDKDTLEHIFEPFFTTKEPGKGTGLGLAMTYNIIQRHNGKIEVKSQKNKGTTFIIKFSLT